MRNLLNPLWLIPINILPVILLFAIFIGEYNIIKTLLNEESIFLWKLFGGILFVLTIILTGTMVLLKVSKKELSIHYSFIVLPVYIIYIYCYGTQLDNIIPWSIPAWMVPDNMLIYVGTFLMPTLIHALFILIAHFTPESKQNKPWKSFLFAIAVPALWYLFALGIIPLNGIFDSSFGIHLAFTFGIIGTVFFLFFLARGFYIITIKKSSSWVKFELLWKIPISLILPIAGLLVNKEFHNIFGDFNHPLFYIVTIINSVLICIPEFEHKKLRLALFLAKATTFAYTLYFFIVFVPYLPLSVIAIIILGAGFLMLAPIVLFIIHIKSLSNDYGYLKSFFAPKLLISGAVIAFFVLPASIHFSYLNDRMVLHETLDYLYSPDYAQNYSINKASLARTISTIKGNKNSRRNSNKRNQTPYLSLYFNWLVLDNLTLSNQKLNAINKIFFNKGGNRLVNQFNRQDRSNIEISDISSTSEYDEEKKAWLSWVDIELTNHGTASFFTEYSTVFNLPEGCAISDYYLNIGDRREMGILAEKKAANWVFNQIRNVNRDPGILSYINANKISFRVFPFSKKEVRKTGIQFIHKEPVTIKIDHQTVQLGEHESPHNEIASSNAPVQYITAHEKEHLPKITRTPYYHFILDVSEYQESFREKHIGRVKAFLAEHKTQEMGAPKLSFSNTYTHAVPFDENWENKLRNIQYSGGFFLERSIQKVLFDSYHQPSNTYPIIVVVTNDFKNAVIQQDFSNFQLAYPESDLFYHLNIQSTLIPYSLNENSKSRLKKAVKSHIPKAVIAWPNAQNPVAFLPDNGQPSIVFKDLTPTFDTTALAPKTWQAALHLQGEIIQRTFFPKAFSPHENNLIKHSFQSRIMTPLTSYIALENEAQKAMLYKKQQEVLKGNKNLDVEEDIRQMSEPELIVLVLLFLLFIVLKKRKTLLIRFIK